MTSHSLPLWPASEVLPVGFGPMLPEVFFERDTVVVAEELLGCLLLSRARGVIVGGRIVETEAYLGTGDAGSHAATKGITERNKVMFGPPARAYVYFTYGNHHMLNFVTERDGVAGAVLVRAIEPLVGVEHMQTRRVGRSGYELTNGPGKLAAALGLDLSDNADTLGKGSLAVFAGELASDESSEFSGRIGLSAGHELLLRRFVRDNGYVSRGRTGPPRRVRLGSGSRKGGTRA